LITNFSFPSRILPIFKPKRFKILYGSRASGKSSSVARYLLLKGREEKLRILCTRELQLSLKDSVHKLLSDLIIEFSMEDFYTITQDAIRGSNGTEFIFAGIRSNPAKIKSTEGIDVCWLEEAESITQESLDLIVPTIRKDNSEIIVVFNPQDELDPIYNTFITPNILALETNDYLYEDDNLLIIKMDYQHNPFLSDVIKDDIERVKKEDYKRYLHVYGGECISSYEDAVFDILWINAAIDSHIKLGFEGIGAKVVGYDPADSSDGDTQGLIARHGSVVTHIDMWKSDITKGIERAFKLLEDTNSTDFVFDGIGVGSAVSHELRKLQGNRNINSTNFKGSGKVRLPTKQFKEGSESNGDLFKNIRAQYFWLLRDRFYKTYLAVVEGKYIDPSELISIPSNSEFITQLRSELSKFKRKRALSSDFIQMESKEDIAKRGIKSPALLDALMYCFANNNIKKDTTTRLRF